ncbi:hypothetical protein EUX98_g5005 [Antrodiella citrinella]|uniref:Protein kinase domain-containing protein n=1 Tax=Antrodiella citrinella TaxID=2447956 RepID=A0A4S4MST5_9APHY|nr:hypothetical protein EUX98_g5005 [Antrodiella citrinella]
MARIADSADMITLSEVSKKEILTCIDDAIPLNQNDSTVAERIPNESSQDALDVLWDLMDPKNGPAKGVKNNRILLPKALRRLTMKLTVHHNKLPHAFYLKGVTCSEKESRGAGGFADVFIGEWKGEGVALKRLRVQTNSSQADEALHKQFCRESLLWMHLDHEHVLPFYGVSDDAFSLSICMVLPWMHNGNIRHYVNVLRETHHIGGQELVQSINQWLHQITLGLIYLLGEDIVHGDLHGGNILIDNRGSVRLTDFGMGLYADASPHKYASKHGGGAFQYRAPELHDPEEFDRDDSRPTVESDIFAFACVCIELYTEHLPFEGASNFAVSKDVVNGLRPPRPVTKDGVVVSDRLWSLIEHCWSQQPEDRPSAQFVEEKLRAIIGSERANDVSLPGIEDTVPQASTTKPELALHPIVGAAEVAHVEPLTPPSVQTVVAPTTALPAPQTVELAVDQPSPLPSNTRATNGHGTAVKVDTQKETNKAEQASSLTPVKSTEPDHVKPPTKAAPVAKNLVASSGKLPDKTPVEEDTGVHKSGCSCIIA